MPASSPEPQDLQTLFDLSVDILIVTSSTEMLAYNPAYETTLGYTAKWLKENNFFDVVHPDDRQITIEQMGKVMQGATTVLFEIRCLTAAGETRWIQWSSRMDPATQRVYAIGRDITNVRIDQERLQRYADLLERTQQELKEAIEELTRVANTDQLTSLLNRHAFEARAHEELSRAERAGHPLAVAMLDIDHFKRVNDTHGHPTGDVVLREVARRLDAARRTHDVLGRWGGEEFIVLLPEATLDEARIAVERMTLAVSARPVIVGSLELPIRLSGGITAGSVAFDTTLHDVVELADAALLQAKRNGRDRIEVEPLPVLS